MFKKRIPALFLALILSTALIACGEEKPLLSPTDYELDAETAATIRGVKIGDGPDAFLAAYRDYDMFCNISDSGYRFISPEEIPFDVNKLAVILPSFFVDNTAINMDAFCEENGIEKDGLLAFLTAEDYLAHHTVVYQYLVFTWKNGAIEDIRSESMDYNKDGSYYEAN